jgi:hypothetical protein
MATSGPLRLLVGLAAPDPRPQAVGRLRQVLHLQRHQLGASEGTGEAQRQQRAVPLADERVRAQRQHLLQHVRGGGRLALPGRADGAADTAQDGLHGLAAGRWLVAGDLVVVADGGSAPTDRAGLAAVGQAGEVGGDDAHVRWQGYGAPGGAPGGEVTEVALIYARRVLDAVCASAKAIVASISAVVSAPGSAGPRGIRSCMKGVQRVYRQHVASM